MCEKTLLAACAIIYLANATPWGHFFYSGGFLQQHPYYINLPHVSKVPFITKCKSDDQNCAKASAQVAIPIFAKGLPESNVEILDPVTFKEVDSSKPDLKFKLSDVTLSGMENCKMKKLIRDVTKSTIHLAFLCETEMNGDYELKGKLLVLPIEGDGKIYVKIEKAQFDVFLNIEDKQGKDGKKHWHIKSWTHSFHLIDKSDVKFENLFNGNEALAKAANELIADNGNEVIKEIGLPMIKATIARVVENIERFFKANPVEDLSID